MEGIPSCYPHFFSSLSPSIFNSSTDSKLDKIWSSKQMEVGLQRLYQGLKHILRRKERYGSRKMRKRSWRSEKTYWEPNSCFHYCPFNVWNLWSLWLNLALEYQNCWFWERNMGKSIGNFLTFSPLDIIHNWQWQVLKPFLNESHSCKWEMWQWFVFCSPWLLWRFDLVIVTWSLTFKSLCVWLFCWEILK